jgi:NAD+ synthetase
MLNNTQCEKIWSHIVKEIRQYCAKYNFQGVTFGLSGGIDSALIAALSIDALGAENVHCFMLSTINTSELSKNLAQKMCQINNIKYQDINIIEILESTIATVPKFKNPLTIENLQSRIRGLLIMTYANDNPWLALCCGNKSEAAVGYCTLYGDTIGGIAPIADLYKTEVYALVNWRNKKSTVIPEGIITRTPSAELRQEQKDQDTLPPYDILDNILYQLIEQNKTPEDITGTDKETITWIYSQYHKMSFKRAQMPPIIKIRHLI